MMPDEFLGGKREIERGGGDMHIFFVLLRIAYYLAEMLEASQAQGIVCK